MNPRFPCFVWVFDEIGCKVGRDRGMDSPSLLVSFLHIFGRLIRLQRKKLLFRKSTRKFRLSCLIKIVKSMIRASFSANSMKRPFGENGSQEEMHCMFRMHLRKHNLSVIYFSFYFIFFLSFFPSFSFSLHLRFLCSAFLCGTDFVYSVL